MRRTAMLLALTLLAGSVIAADKPKDAKEATGPVSAAGIVTDVKPDSATIWIDGEDAPSKFAFGAGFDKTAFGFPPAGKGIFTVGRVQFTYSKSDDSNKLLTIKKEQPLAQGTVTGVVLFSNDFWVAVKPKVGSPEGYAINWPPGDMVARLKALQKGDTVTIKFHTDVERHRIDALQVVPAKPEKAAEPPPLRPAPVPATSPAASQPAPTPEEQAGRKLQLAQLYIRNGLLDRARDMLQDIIRLYPDTEAAKTAKTRLTELGE